MAVVLGPAGDVFQQLALTFVALANVIGVMPLTTVFEAVQAEEFTVGAEGVEQLLWRAVDVEAEFLQLGITRLQRST